MAVPQAVPLICYRDRQRCVCKEQSEHNQDDTGYGATYTRPLHLLSEPFRVPQDVQPRMLSKITAMIDYLLRKLKLKSKDARSKCSEALCRGLITITDPISIIDAAWCSHNSCNSVCTAWRTRNLCVHDKLLASIACKNYALVEQLFPMSLKCCTTAPAMAICNPLAFAVGVCEFGNPRRIIPNRGLLSLVLEFPYFTRPHEQENQVVARVSH